MQIVKTNTAHRRTPEYYRRIGLVVTVGITTGSWVLILRLVGYAFDLRISAGFTIVFALVVAAAAFVVVDILVRRAVSRGETEVTGHDAASSQGHRERDTPRCPRAIRATEY